ncbi:Metallophosphoesterase [Trichormus variabilis ATCC 29413]|uniref:Metallophosphoesterase n=2 Tax=Anabaena variabilis TaxID=264691 RepID=Q3M9I5_TRIV2|nr:MULTISPECIES: metallophosphoesterase [Nostocaceae]ABA22351.1 Metallophosphoesterase [Trichormus variabilis ATCC 29413]MBC1213240.1 metallophosphoesterase [Trichormus variabilis ARAD]MBC1256044.1 metallophosphoesterase [Trichormus variabilis V5]MBC1268080.1 metallophosphoesterase [Trichormus variabilis FSR]MBC1301783.1 metallophosphoesterase [Trichormus variabilis N2B]
MHWFFTGRLSVDKITVKIANLSPSLQGIKLVQLSDFHYDGLRLSEEMLEEAIAVTNEAEPDLILLTGDYVTDDPTPINQLALRLKYLQSRYGIFAVLGNHDIHYSHSQTLITKALTSIGVNVLWNEIAYPLGHELPIVGLADYWSKEFHPASVMNKLDPTTPRIVLSHNPDTAKILEQWRVDLQLSGHTHGGHIVLPGIGPVVYHYKKLLKKAPRKLRRWVPFLLGDCSKVVRYWEWAQGFHQVTNNQLYVNRGLGTYRPGRLFCPPEVTVITLT